MTATLTVPEERARFLFPVADETVPVADLFDEAVGALPEAGRRMIPPCHVTRVIQMVITPGRFLPGSGGARFVVVVDAHVVTLRALADAAEETRTTTALAEGSPA